MFNVFETALKYIIQRLPTMSSSLFIDRFTLNVSDLSVPHNNE